MDFFNNLITQAGNFAGTAGGQKLLFGTAPAAANVTSPAPMAPNKGPNLMLILGGIAAVAVVLFFVLRRK